MNGINELIEDLEMERGLACYGDRLKRTIKRTITALQEMQQRIAKLEQRYGDDEIATSVNVILQQRITKLEADRDKWQSKAHHQNQDNLILQSRIAKLEAKNEQHCKAHLMSIDKIKRLDVALAEIKEYFGRDFDRYPGLVEIYRKVRAG